jgi:hypothetical protein
MPFFLLSRDDNDELRLLTPTASPSRQDALAVLSRMTADPGFDAWGAEVLLIDIDAALPVLLVRPSDNASVIDARAVAVEVDEVESVHSAEKDVTFLWPAAEEITADAEPPAKAESVPEISAEEAEAFASYVSLAEDDSPVETSVGFLADDPAPLSTNDALPVPELAKELEPEPGPEVEPEPEPQPEPQLEPEPEPASFVELVSSSQLEGASESEEDREPGPIGAAYAPFEPAETTASSVVNGYELRDALARTTAAMEIEALASDWAEVVEPPTTEADTLIDRWPWEVAAAPTAMPLVPPLEARNGPAEEDGPVESGAGAIDAPEVADADAAEDIGDIAEAPSAFLDDLEPIPAAPLHEGPATEVEEPALEQSPEADDSREPEVVDSEPTIAEPLVSDAEAPAPEPVVPPREPASMDEYVCDDCVYVETCPNKDQRLPKDCGSFQWK